jgi:hypothetical protein
MLPQSTHPELRLTYDNLLYLCVHCNEMKLSKCVVDPCSLDLRSSVAVSDDGTIRALTSDGQLLIDVFRLDSADRTEYRAKLLRLFRCAERCGSEMKDWLGFPRCLPDLQRKRAPVNSRPEGVQDCFFVRRERGVLPEFY